MSWQILVYFCNTHTHMHTHYAKQSQMENDSLIIIVSLVSELTHVMHDKNNTRLERWSLINETMWLSMKSCLLLLHIRSADGEKTLRANIWLFACYARFQNVCWLVFFMIKFRLNFCQSLCFSAQWFIRVADFFRLYASRPSQFDCHKVLWLA